MWFWIPRNRIPPDPLNPIFLINLLSMADKLRLLIMIIPFEALLFKNSDYSNETVNGILNLVWLSVYNTLLAGKLI